ncbi:MAG: MATE family efflux transporter [Spirochaetes bacterium]|jgi:putative MATE family efflux protein|nr:MATE family efflux transporter [Spirochaetota bacterium]
MKIVKSLDDRMTIVALSWPIIVETFLRMMFSNVDVMMLSQYSDDAVAAVGLIGQLVFFVIILFMMVNTGATTLISQYNGSERFTESSNIASAAVVLGMFFGIIATLLLTIGGDRILGIYDLAPAVHGYALDYLFIFGLFAIGTALSTVFAAILRSYGYTQEAMIATFGCNLLNIVGNYAFLFGPLGIPVLGVKGVAISTVASNGINALIMFYIIFQKKEIAISLKAMISTPIKAYKQILNFGLPNGGEFLSFNLAQLASYKVIALAGTASLTAAVYTQTFQRFIMIIPFALMQSSQIFVGYLVGKRRNDEAYKSITRIWTAVFCIALSLSLIAAFFRYELIGIFTDDPEIISIAVTLVVAAVLWETGRTFNLIFIGGLKGAGDVHFPVRVGIVSMWGIAVFFSYLLGNTFGLGALGVWIAFSMDEWGRGIVMSFRWRSRVWEKKSVV